MHLEYDVNNNSAYGIRTVTFGADLDYPEGTGEHLVLEQGGEFVAALDLDPDRADWHEVREALHRALPGEWAVRPTGGNIRGDASHANRYVRSDEWAVVPGPGES